MRYAEVIVDEAGGPLDRPFTYKIPDGMEPLPGQRVLAPFGKRSLEGYVVALKDETDLPEAKIRPLARLLEDYPALLPEMLELGLWMREKYRCTLRDAFRQMIPAEMRGERVRPKTEKFARLLVSGEALDAARAENARAKGRLALLEALEGGEKRVSELESEHPGALTKLRELEKRGALTIEERETNRLTYARPVSSSRDPILTRTQRDAVSALTGALDEGGGAFLLHGVTGSGKTEAYIRLIRACLARGRTAIVLVPEIALTPQMTDWFRARFGGEAAVLHSRLSAGERYDEWRRIRFGEARVVVGARSAVFAPLSKLGAVIVDEEHESSYLSERSPRYDARDVAKKRAETHGAVLVLGSATPSIASYMKAMPGVRPENRLTLLEMPERVNGGPLPEVRVVDMRTEMLRGNRSMFSVALADALRETVAQGRQAMLFINRRGHSTFVECRACGYVEKCTHCDVSMTYHMAENALICHYCDERRAPPTQCPACGSPYIRYFGTGTQKVQAEVEKLLPGVPILRMDADTTSAKGAHERLLSSFRRGEAKVLIGTQMIAKGLDFPKVTLVGVVAADMSLHLPDYRSPERTFQLITQVAGRAGRAADAGVVYVQTYDPDHYAVSLAAKQDFRAFYVEEVKRRRRGLYPPYTVLARLLVTAPDEGQAEEAARALEAELNEYLDGRVEARKDTVQMRALEAPIKRIRGEARWQVFIKMYARASADATLSFMDELSRRDRDDKARVELEVNPASMI